MGGNALQIAYIAVTDARIGLPKYGYAAKSRSIGAEMMPAFSQLRQRMTTTITGGPDCCISRVAEAHPRVLQLRELIKDVWHQEVQQVVQLMQVILQWGACTAWAVRNLLWFGTAAPAACLDGAPWQQLPAKLRLPFICCAYCTQGTSAKTWIAAKATN